MREDRQKRILEMIATERIETQEELAARLAQEGFVVTQATISRDIRKLQLVKISDNDGRQYYSVGGKSGAQHNETYIRTLRDGYISADVAQNLVVVKTASGMAMAVAASIDALSLPHVLGCIAGDDTIFCATGDQARAKQVLAQLEAYMER